MITAAHQVEGRIAAYWPNAEVAIDWRTRTVCVQLAEDDTVTHGALASFTDTLEAFDIEVDLRTRVLRFKLSWG